MFAVTDHDYVSDLQPLVEQMGLKNLLRVVPGIEVTPFPYGHFNGWPVEPDNTSANHGAIDWGARRDRRARDDAGRDLRRDARPRRARWSRSTTRATRASPSSRPTSIARTSSSTTTQRMIYGDYENADVPNDLEEI